jgi:integrase
VIQKASQPTFSECATRYIQAKRAEWSNPKHASQWGNTLRDYALPVLGQLPIDTIERNHVLACLEPIWHLKTETASRVRGRIESIWNWAKAHGYVSGDNPAAWKGALQPLLASPAKVQKTLSHPAMPYVDVPRFLLQLKSIESLGSLALQFLIMTACRTSEVIEARWDEINDSVWTIPAERMKAKKEHRVPLSQEAMELLINCPKTGAYVFGHLHKSKAGIVQKPISNMTMAQILKRHGGSDFTVHGFRSSFRDWSAEQTQYPREVCENALAHQLPDRVEAAYLRTDWIEQRRRLMQDWATFVTTT